MSPSSSVTELEAALSQEGWPTKDFGLMPIPKRLQYNPVKPFRFDLLLNASFGFASTFSMNFSIDGEHMLMRRDSCC